MSTRDANEKKFKYWKNRPDGGRLYYRRVEGQRGWHAVYLKETSAGEETLRFWQEIYNDRDELVEIHEKYPKDLGHRKV